MGRTEQALLLLLGVVATGRALKVDDVPHPVVRKLSDWTYYPENASIGIVTGGTPDLYARANYGSKAASIMLKYAKKHGYAFYVDKNLGRLSTRAKGWNKVMLMTKLLREVQTLVWMDADMVITDDSKSLEALLEKLKCDGAQQHRWANYLPVKADNNTFMWLSADVSPGRYLVNANTAMVVLRRSHEAFDFLTKVWRAGDDPNHFQHHDDPMRFMHKDPKSPDYGWPWEQGAVWDVLAKEPSRYLRKTCIAPETQMHSVRPYKWSPGQFAQHNGGLPDELRRKQGQAQLLKLGGKPEIK
mmetsp:Transcript_65771/g.203894  ORF Transcript_65771/g.203894 Transcript_65771/m.203894 type:complete len:300 (-) Transcript_65771:78-977(-)